MGKSSGDAPDTVAAAKETGKQALILNEAQTAANRPSQSNAWGQTGWNVSGYKDPATGQIMNKWEQTETLNPLLQQSFDTQQRIGAGRSALAEGGMARVWDQYSNPMDFEQYGRPIDAAQTQPVQSFDFNQGFDGFDYSPGDERMRAEDAAYNRATSRLDPQFAQRENAMKVQLQNQGLAPGDQAYDAAMGNFDRSRNDAYQQARYGATSEGRTEAGQMFGQALGTQQQRVGEQGQLFGQSLAGTQANNQAQAQQYGQNMQSAQLANALRSQGMQEDLFARNYDLDEVNRLLAGQQISGGPPVTGGETQTLVGGLLEGQ